MTEPSTSSAHKSACCGAPARFMQDTVGCLQSCGWVCTKCWKGCNKGLIAPPGKEEVEEIRDYVEAEGKNGSRHIRSTSKDIRVCLSYIRTLEEENKKMQEALEQIARGNHGVDEHGLWVQPREVATKALSPLLP